MACFRGRPVRDVIARLLAQPLDNIGIPSQAHQSGHPIQGIPRATPQICVRLRPLVDKRQRNRQLCRNLLGTRLLKCLFQDFVGFAHLLSTLTISIALGHRKILSIATKHHFYYNGNDELNV